MASRDHTARFRPSFPDDDTLKASPGDPPDRGSAAPALLAYDRLDVAIAILALVRLRCDSERFRKSKAWGLPAKALEFPFSAEVITALSIAIHCLEHAVYGPGHEPTLNA
ncbi:hypothetical protein [Dyella telluris]|uniref:Uncharacterized protein n=1 Tax=Dyella telluris TaxID=2763498 RepID=A0A7G8Q2C4_9GAMM|nr:hypothetical protein [Dyella telluris]QNK00932.1 hypothetical protein H8F01_17935 [Dyella telluris]